MINDILTLVLEQISSKVPELKYLSEDEGQFDYYHENPPVKFPACLVEMQQVQWSDLGKRIQDGKIFVSIMVADLRLSNSNLKAPTSQKVKAASIWIILENIHKALHCWAPDNQYYGLLTRISTRKIKRDDGIRQFEVVYCAQCVDETATPTQASVSNVTPVISND